MNAFAVWLLHSAAWGSVLLLVAWLAARRPGQPGRRQRVAEAGMLAALVVAGLAWQSGWLVPLSFPSRTLPGAASTPDVEAALPQSTLVPWAFEGDAWFPAPWASGDPPGGPDAVPLETAHPPIAGQEASSPWVSGIFFADGWMALFGLYLLGSACAIGYSLLGYAGLWRLVRAARPAAPESMQLLAEVAGTRRLPRLLVSARLRSPLSCGVLRPTIILPESLCGERKLRWALRHELAHLERRDAISCLLFTLGQAVYYYLPWFWWLRRQARLCQEYLADAVAAPAEQSIDYAQFLLNLSSPAMLRGCAAGVAGVHSDLYRRITMLLNPSNALAKRCTWWGTALAVTGILVVGVLLSGIGITSAPLSAAQREETKKTDKKAEKKDLIKTPEEILKNLPAGLDAETMKKIKQVLDEQFKRSRVELERARKEMERAQEQMKKAMEQMRKQFPDIGKKGGFGGFGPPGGFGGGVGGFGGGFAFVQPQMRLGVSLDKPSPIVAEQLDLPKGQGLVVRQVMPNSPAAKGGIKSNDILMEFAGKKVADNPMEMAQIVKDVKADSPVDAVVLRKGKRETIKGIILPEIKPFTPPGFGGGIGGKDFLIPGPFGAGMKGTVTTVIRTDDSVRINHGHGKLHVNVVGKVEDGKTKVTSIHIQDGAGAGHSYKTVDEVPEQHRELVRGLLRMAEDHTIRAQTKSAPK
jgi:hypothetical protein